MIKPLQNNIILQQKEKPEDAKTASGIILPEDQRLVDMERIVVAVGPDVKGEIKVGDIVVIANLPTEKCSDFDVVREELILAIV